MSRKVRVAFLIDAIESPTAGSERQLLMLLESLDRELFDPWLCVLRNTPWLEKEFRLCPVKVLGVDTLLSVSTPVAMMRFALWLRRAPADVLQVHFVDSSIVGIVSSFLAPRTVVVAARKNQGYWMGSRSLFLLKTLNLGVERFLANSRSTADWVSRTEGVAAEKIQVIHNGLDLPGSSRHGAEARVRARAALGIAPEVPVVGMVANLRPVKRADVFLEAAVKIRAARPDTVFLLVGDGPERAKIEQLGAKLGLNGTLRLLGSRRDVPDLLPGLDVGVMTSDSESFSNSLLEYMAAGLPIVTTEVGGCREALGSSGAGIVVPPGRPGDVADGVLTLLGDVGLRQWAALDHPLRVRELFSRQAYVCAHQEFYCRLVRTAGFF